MSEQKIEVNLPVFDNEGNQVDTTVAYLSQDQLNDLVAQATEVVNAYRAINDNLLDQQVERQVNQSIAELEEAMVSSSLIEDIWDY